MNRVIPLIESSLIAIFRFDHPSGDAHVDPEEEVATHHSVSFLERGSFDLLIGRRRWRLSPGMVFITHPDLPYRCHHAEKLPEDVCLSITYSDAFVEDVRQVTSTCARWPCPVALPTNRLGYLRLLLSRLAENCADALAIESFAGELLAAATAADTREKNLYTNSQLAWYAERMEAVRTLLQEQYAESHSLASLARAVGMSPFQFSRVFCELVGTPPHRYLVNVRLARAAERLREGASVTDTCFVVGFGNLSHFIRLFRRTFGVSPSRFCR